MNPSPGPWRAARAFDMTRWRVVRTVTPHNGGLPLLETYGENGPEEYASQPAAQVVANVLNSTHPRVGHPHAQVMAQYAEDARTASAPWLLWEWRPLAGGPWKSLASSPAWDLRSLYRRKPRTVMINGYEVPEPERVVSAGWRGEYWIPDVARNPLVLGPCMWDGDATDLERLRRGLVHLTQEAAELHARALISLTGAP